MKERFHMLYTRFRAAYLRGVLLHGGAILLFYLSTLLFFYPTFFQGASLQQQDIQQFIGTVHQTHAKSGEASMPALWNHAIFSGMPSYLAAGISWKKPVMSVMHRVLHLNLSHPTWIIFVSLLSMYVLLLAFGIRPYLAVIGAIAFTFSSYAVVGITAGHNSRIAAVAYMPLLLASVHLAYTRWRWGGAVLAFASAALLVNAGHVQISYYAILMLLFYTVHRALEAYRERHIAAFAKSSGALLLAGLLAFSTYYPDFITLYEYSKHSIRGDRILSPLPAPVAASGAQVAPPRDAPSSGLSKDYAFQYSNALSEPLTLLIPNFYGGRVAGGVLSLDDSHVARTMRNRGVERVQIQQVLQGLHAYRGDQPITSPYYAGAIVVLLFVIALFVLPRRTYMWVLGLVVLGIVLSWGRNFSWFNYLLFDYLPGYNKFRSPTFAIVFSILGMVLLGMQALEQCLRSPLSPAGRRRLLYAFASVGGFLLLVGLAAGIGTYAAPLDEQLRQSQFPEWLIEALRMDRASLLRRDAFRSLLFVAMAGAVLYLLLWRRKQPLVWGLVLLGLVTLDLVGYNSRIYTPEKSFKRAGRSFAFEPNEADTRIVKDTSDYRVMNVPNPFSDSRASYHHASIGGYHPAKLRRYQDLIDRHLTPERSTLRQRARAGRPVPVHLPVLSMLNTKYFVFGPTEQHVLQNPYAYGNAWLVSGIMPVGSADEEIAALAAQDLRRYAVIDTAAMVLEGGLLRDSVFTTRGQVRLVARGHNVLRYRADVSAPALVVFSEIYYPDDWHAYVDEEEKPILRVNYALRGLFLEPGQHELVFRVRSETYLQGLAVNNLSAITSGVVLVLTLGGLLLAFVQRLRVPAGEVRANIFGLGIGFMRSKDKKVKWAIAGVSFFFVLVMVVVTFFARVYENEADRAGNMNIEGAHLFYLVIFYSLTVMVAVYFVRVLIVLTRKKP